MKFDPDVVRQRILRTLDRRMLIDSSRQTYSPDDVLRMVDQVIQGEFNMIELQARSAEDAFAAGALDSHRPSRGMTGPFVESSQDLPHTFAKHVHGGLRQEPEDDDIIDAEIVDES